MVETRGCLNVDRKGPVQKKKSEDLGEKWICF